MRDTGSACAGRRHLVRRNPAINDRLRRDGLGATCDDVGRSGLFGALSARSKGVARAGCPLAAGFLDEERLPRRALRGSTC
jgi:hypothetical protein